MGRVSQHIDQLRPEIRRAVFGNVGSIIAIRVGYSDAEVLDREFGRAYCAEQFTRLSNHHILATLMMDGEFVEPFAGRTLRSSGKRYRRRETIITRSPHRYALGRDVVEERIRKWLGEFPR